MSSLMLAHFPMVDVNLDCGAVALKRSSSLCANVLALCDRKFYDSGKTSIEICHEISARFCA